MILYIILLKLLSNNFNKSNIKNIRVNDSKYMYVNNIYKYVSMYSLIYKYYDEFINNKFTNNNSELVKINEYLKNNHNNYLFL